MLLSLWLAACVVVPVAVEQSILEGRQYSDSDLQFVKTGVTTREEIAIHLGPPTIWLPAQRILVYGLRRVAGTGFVWFVAEPSGSGFGSMTQTEERAAVFLAIGERDTVTQWGRAQVRRGVTWLGAALEWSVTAGLSVPQPRVAFVETSPADADQGLVYFYRPRDNQYYLPLLPPAEKLMPGYANFVNIFRDGELVAQLRWQTYVAVPVAPGEHTFVLSADTDDVTNPQLYRDAGIRLSRAPMGSSFIDVRVEAGKGHIEPVLIERSYAEAISAIGALRESW